MKKLLLLLLLFSFLTPTFSQVIIEGKSYKADTLLFKKQVGPGVYHSSYRLPDYPLEFQVMEIDLKNPYVDIETCKAGDRAVATEKPTNMGVRKSMPGHEVIGGTNGDFYFYQDPPEIGIPRSGQFLNGEIIANPTGRASFILGVNKKPYVDRINFRGDLIKGGNKIRIHTVNMLRLEWEPTAKNFLTLYTDKFGTSTSAIQGGTKVIIRPKIGESFFIGANDTLSCVVESVEDNIGATSIPKGKAVLHGRDETSTFLKSLALGDEITLAFRTLLTTTPNVLSRFKEQVGGSDCIVLKNGSAQNEGKTASAGKNPRTGMGFSQDSTKVYMLVVDGRSSLSTGLDLLPFGELFYAVGAWNAVNLDGGGSSVMFVNGEVKNTPSDGTVRAVGNGVLVVSTAPVDNTIASIKPLYDKVLLPRYGFYNPVILGYNKYGALIDKDVKNVTLSVSSEIGEIRNDSLLFMSGTENGILKVTYNGEITTYINVKQVTDAAVKIRLDSVLLDNTIKYPIQVLAKTKEGSIFEILPTALNWEIINPNVCKVTQGVLEGLNNGSSLIIGSIGSFKDTLKVNVEISETPTRIAKDFAVNSNWSITTSTNLGSLTHAPTETGLKSTFKYSVGRSPNISYFNIFPFYSLPDTFKIKFNPGSITLSKVIMRFTSAGSTVNKEYTGFVKNQDNTISIPIDQIVTDLSDVTSYPVSFNFMKFMIDAGSMVADQSYAMEIKELILSYGKIETGFNTTEHSAYFSIFPNPAKSQIHIKTNPENVTSFKVRLLDLTGHLLKSWSFGGYSQEIITIPLAYIVPGTYFLHIQKTNKPAEIFKFIKQ